MKRTLLLASLAFLLSSNVSFSQLTSANAAKSSTVTTNDLQNTSALKPEDGQAYVFSSKEDLENAVPFKINGIKDQIVAGKLSEVQVKELREQIWRLENATVRK